MPRTLFSLRGLCAAILLILTGCGDSSSNPKVIKSKLDDHYRGKLVTTPAFFSETGVRQAVEDGVLAEKDAVLLGVRVKGSGGFTSGPKGNGIVRDAFYPFGTKPLRVNLEQACRVVVTEVTGCRTEQGRIFVEFNLRVEYPAVIQKYLASDANVVASPGELETGLAKSFRDEVPSHGTAEFVKYDDGWRLSNVNP